MKRGLVRFNAAYHSGLERDVIPKLLRRMTEVGNLVKLTWSINCFYFFSKKRHSLICFLTPTSEFLTNSKTWLLIQLCQYDLFWSAVSASYLHSESTRHQYHPTILFLFQTCIKVTHLEVTAPYFKQNYYRSRSKRPFQEFPTAKVSIKQKIRYPKFCKILEQ